MATSIPQHEAELKALLDSFDLTIPGKEGSLAKDMATTAALGIVDRTIDEQKDATGGDLKKLDPKYAKSKLKKYRSDRIGHRTGQMMSLESVRGRLDIRPDEVTMTYGTGQATGGDPPDEAKARYFTDQGRPFYELDPAIEGQVEDTAREAFERHFQ